MLEWMTIARMCVCLRKKDVRLDDKCEKVAIRTIVVTFGQDGAT